jgi:hypothetical protein
VRVIEAAALEFIDENGGGAGVRLRKPPEKQDLLQKRWAISNFDA